MQIRMFKPFSACIAAAFYSRLNDDFQLQFTLPDTWLRKVSRRSQAPNIAENTLLSALHEISLI